jgi:hypothetical protein
MIGLVTPGKGEEDNKNDVFGSYFFSKLFLVNHIFH